MSNWKFYCETRSDIPLPPEYTFPRAFNYLNSESNSFFILEEKNGDYIQCGGDRDACAVEIRRYDSNDEYTHEIFGFVGGSSQPASVQMSDGIANVHEGEILDRWDAIELFKCFFEGAEFPSKFALRRVEL